MGLSAGLIDDLLLLPQDYRSSSLGGEGNSSEHGGEREREREPRVDRGNWGEMEGERGVGGRGGGVSVKMEGKIEEGRWEEKQREGREGTRLGGENKESKMETEGREGGDVQMCL